MTLKIRCRVADFVIPRVASRSPHGIDRGRDAAVTREHHDLGRGIDRDQLLHQLEPVAITEPEIDAFIAALETEPDPLRLLAG